MEKGRGGKEMNVKGHTNSRLVRFGGGEGEVNWGKGEERGEGEEGEENEGDIEEGG